jgi:MarR family transcriptional regulator for hemolysin
MTLAEQLASIRRTLHRLLTRRLGRHTDRSFTQLLALRVIDRGEVQAQAALAERLTVDPPAVSRLVERLAEDGLLKRCPGEDRRCVRLEVTAKGHEEAAVLHSELQSLEGEVRKYLTAQEMKTLRQLLDKLQDGLKAVSETPSTEAAQRAE